MAERMVQTLAHNWVDRLVETMVYAKVDGKDND